MRPLCLVVAFWLSLAGTLSAQTVCENACTFAPGEAVSVMADSGVDPAWAFSLFLNGQPAAAPVRFEGAVIVYEFPTGFLEGLYAVKLEGRKGTELVASWANTFTVAKPPPAPAPEAPGCKTGGSLVPIGSLLSWSGRHGEADAFIAAREVEGWALVPGSRRKVRNTTFLQMECHG